MTTTTIRSALLRRAIALVAIAAVAVLGVRVGRTLRGPTPTDADRGSDFAAPAALAPGARIPDVALVGTDGAATSLHAVLRERGGVVLFLDLDCGSCSVVTRDWQQRIADERLHDVTVVGVAAASAHAIQSYVRDKRISFPVYDDSARALMNQYGLTSFPLQIVVGQSLTVQSAMMPGVTTAAAPVDAATLRAQLAR